MRYLSTAAIASFTLLVACDVSDLDVLGASPSRPQIDIPKEVTTVSTAEIAGSWSCRELNPYPDTPNVAVAMTFAADGTMAAESTVPMEQAMPGAGDMLMTWTGNWAVEGDRLITTGTEVETVMVDGSDTGFAGLLNQFIARYSDRASDGNAEVLRISATDLVMRNEDPDAPTMACLRQA